MTNFLHLIIAIIFAPIYLFSETVIIYATQSAQYSANDCCTLNILTNQNSDSLYSQDCQDMGTYYGCGMSKHAPFWLFDLSILDSSIDIQSIQFNGNIPTEDWSDVYLSVSTTIGQISTSIASDLWSGGDWASGNGQYSSINWAMGDFSQNLPLEIISQGVISGQLNILTYTSNPWTIFSIVNSGDDAPRLVIDYENIDEDCTADDGTDGVELWGECYSIENTDSLHLREIPIIEPIPSSIGYLINLVYLNLRETQIYGIIPSTIGSLSTLRYLDLSLNDLNGEIPEEIWSLTNLEWLNLRGNSIIGEVSPNIFNLSHLEALALYDNNLTGSIPSEIGNLPNLIYLHLNNNAFTGSIPSEIGNLSNLNQLVLNDNALIGSIPFEIGNLDELLYLYLQNNNLTGSIPPELGSLTNLVQLFIFNNQLSGLIPNEICNIANIDPHYYNNQLCPPYPSCIEVNLGIQDTSNCEQVSIIDETLPITYNLYNAYPNPFNPVTTLRYDLPEDALVNITIYDMMGRQVKALVNGSQTAGYRSMHWNATNDRNEPVSAGLYLYAIQAGDYTQTKKMVLLK